MSRRIFRPVVGQVISGPCAMKIRLRSEECVEVARWFRLGVGPRRRKGRGARERMPKVELMPGTVTLIGGPSGAGKSVLLRKVREQYKEDGVRWIDLDAIELGCEPVVNCFGDQSLEETLLLLGRVGLGEAWTYLRLPWELSEGQRFRLRLAMALHAVAQRRIRDAAALCPGVVIACDEFCAVLDRLTALVVSNCLRKVVSATEGLSAVVATGHDDLMGALKPDLVVRCDFGRVKIEKQECGL